MKVTWIKWRYSSTVS